MIKRDEIDDSTSCLNRARDSERLFVLLARDAAAPIAIRAWVAERIRLGKNVLTDGQIVEALDCAQRMETERAEIAAAQRQEKLWAEEGVGRPTFEGKCCPAHIRSDGYHSESCPSRVGASLIECSRLQSTRDMTPRQALFPHWANFAAGFASAREAPCTLENCVGRACVHKPGVCWSPAMFSHKGTRSHRVVESLSLLVFDIEGVTNDQLGVIGDRLSGHRYLTYATHSDRPNRRAVHMVVALSRAVTGHEWSRFWQAAAAKFAPEAADLACADPVRIYFMPSRPTGADYFFMSKDGQPLDVDTILKTAPQPRATSGLEGTVSL